MFDYTPYDGSRTPFSIGLKPLDPEDWIEPDGRLARDLGEKERLFFEEGETVFRAEAGTRDAQREALDLLLAYLPRRYPGLYGRDAAGRIVVRATGAAYAPAEWEAQPLALAARLVSDDLVLMRKAGASWRLAAAALCFPSSWSLAEKFGRDMAAIHAGVPGYPGAMAGRVDRVFDHLAADRPVWRMNWSIYDDPELFHPRSKHVEGQVETGQAPSLAQLFIRVERQTLRRLPVSGDLLFTVRIYHHPLAMLARHPRGSLLARGLREQLLGLDADQLRYKGLTAHREALAEMLGGLAAKGGGVPA